MVAGSSRRGCGVRATHRSTDGTRVERTRVHVLRHAWGSNGEPRGGGRRCIHAAHRELQVHLRQQQFLLSARLADDKGGLTQMILSNRKGFVLPTVIFAI